ncbi:hypothetical protein Fmac_008670 [Flemingia macrophylla]|uniref:Uncharacterized protein n=1 Tax=Flemingia macrophylla TaxID=520843 RepID=A0ABD1N0G1_9FABA
MKDKTKAKTKLNVKPSRRSRLLESCHVGVVARVNTGVSRQNRRKLQLEEKWKDETK